MFFLLSSKFSLTDNVVVAQSVVVAPIKAKLDNRETACSAIKFDR